MQIAEAGAY